MAIWDCVLIPLLVDDPLWESLLNLSSWNVQRLNPSFSGWPSLGPSCYMAKKQSKRLNPSFSGWPSLGNIEKTEICGKMYVLIPLLVDDPLWGLNEVLMVIPIQVLIPLLVDDPLWVYRYSYRYLIFRCSLNPSFSGWPSLGTNELIT